MKTKIVILSLFLSGTAVANCPHHSTVIYSCQIFQGKTECTWNPTHGWYQGSASNGAAITEGAHATRFLRAFWTPNAHITSDSKISYGVTICQYSYQGNLIQLFQQDRDINIPNPSRKNENLWLVEEWQGVKGYGCSASETLCHFEYGERA